MQNLEFLTTQKPMPLVTLPVRTTVVQLDAARVLLSPGSTLTAEQLRGCGDVTDIVAPSLFHTAGMKQAAQVFPRARLWGPAGCEQKLPTLTWTGQLGVDAWPYEEELSLVTLDGMPQLNESVFLHRASNSLIVTDLAFNIEDASGVGAWLIYQLFGTWRRFGVSRLFLKAVKDRPAFEASVARVMSLSFDNLVPAHGEVLEGDARARLLRALQERNVHLVP